MNQAINIIKFANPLFQRTLEQNSRKDQKVVHGTFTSTMNIFARAQCTMQIICDFSSQWQ